MENGDDGGVRDVHSDFYYSGADENIDVAAVELVHYFLLFFWFHFAVKDIDGEVGKCVCYEMFVLLFHRAKGGFFIFSDARAEDVCLMSFFDFFADVFVRLLYLV